MVPHLMKLNTLAIIHVQILFLSNCKHIMVLQKVNIPNQLLSLKFTEETFLFPVKQCNMTFFGAHKQVLAISCEIHRLIRAKII
jgi:hypothetical protein